MGDDLSAPVEQKEIGLLISKLREQAGLTTTALAQRVGISQAQISRLENGKQGFRSSTLARVCHALGYDAKLLLVPRVAHQPSEPSQD